MLRPVRTLLLAAAALLLAACASTPRIQVDADPAAEFNRYRTFAFVSPLGTDRGEYGTLLSQRLKAAAQRELESRGYRLVEADPDLLVNFNVAVADRVETTPGPAFGMGYYGYRGGFYSPWAGWGSNEVRSYREGTLNVDLVDAARKQLVWEGLAVGRLSRQTTRDPQAAADAAIGEIFARFPYRAP
jgi:hypothetical protein